MGGITRYHRRPPRFLLFRQRVHTRSGGAARACARGYLLPGPAAPPVRSFLLVKPGVQDTWREKGLRGVDFVEADGTLT